MDKKEMEIPLKKQWTYLSFIIFPFTPLMLGTGKKSK